MVGYSRMRWFFVQKFWLNSTFPPDWPNFLHLQHNVQSMPRTDYYWANPVFKGITFGFTMFQINALNNSPSRMGLFACNYVIVHILGEI